MVVLFNYLFALPVVAVDNNLRIVLHGASAVSAFTCLLRCFHCSLFILILEYKTLYFQGWTVPERSRPVWKPPAKYWNVIWLFCVILSSK